MPKSLDSNSLPFLIFDLTRGLRAEFEKQIAKAPIDLTPAEARFLANAARHAPCRMKTIADNLALSAMSVSEVAAKLEDRGLIRLVADPEDGRAKLIELTDKADHALTIIRDTGDAIMARAQGTIAPHEWERFRAIALQIKENLTGRQDA